jgi:4-amino-4-deoxy-L-arabinose transferase-like glycosyltransferase/Tfp pilus assembly protein PilF
VSRHRNHSRQEPAGASAASHPTRTRIYLGLAAVLLAGAALRAAYFRDLRNDPLYLHPALDAELHQYWARALSSGDWTAPRGRNDPKIETTPYFRPPGYPYALAAVDRITGGSPESVRLAQFVLGLCTCVLGFLLGRRLSGSAAGLWAAAGLASSWTLIFFEGELLDSSLLAALVLGSILALDAASRRPSTARFALAGALLGLASLVRPNVLLFLPPAAAWLYVRVRAGGSRRRLASAAAATLLAATLLTVLPATLRNYRVSGEWVLISANGGINLWAGNNPDADGVRAAIPGIEHLAGISGWTCFDYPLVVDGLSHELGRPVGYAEASRIWARRAWSWIRSHPASFARLTARRAGLLFGPREIGDRDVDLSREASPVLRRLPGRFPVVLALAIVGWFGLMGDARGWRLRPAPRAAGFPSPGDPGPASLAILLVIFIVSYGASFLPFFFNARYRVPILAVLLVLSGCALARWIGLLRARAWGPAARVALVATAIGAVASLDPVGYPRALDEWHYQRACAYRDARLPGDAIREYEAAVAANPRSIRARNDLALVLRDQGRLPEAISQWNAALADDPHAVEPRFNRAQMLAALGRYAQSIPEYRRVLEDDPGHVMAHLSLGTALLQIGRKDAAFAQYGEAERLAPRDPLVAFVIGRALVADGRRPEGIGELERALALEPGYEPARRALAEARTGP